MFSQDIDCHKCGCSNKLGTVFCRNCGAKLKFSKQLMDSSKSKRVKKIFMRAINAGIVLAVLIIIGMAFCPFGFPAAPKLPSETEIAATLVTCQEIDTTLGREYGKVTFEFTPAEATFAANYLAVEHERKRPGASGTGTSRGLGGVGKMGTSSDLGGTGKMGTSSDLGGTGKMQFEEKPDPSSSGGDYVDPDLVKRQAWMQRKQKEKLEAGKPKLSPTFDLLVTIKDDKTLSIVVKEEWLHFIPCRLELFIVPKLVVNAKEKKKTMVYELGAARFGYLPLPLYLKDHILSSFESLIMTERKWAKEYLASIKNIEIKNDKICVTFSK